MVVVVDHTAAVGSIPFGPVVPDLRPHRRYRFGSAEEVKRLLITGTRHGWDETELKEALADAHRQLNQPGESAVLVHGAAPGVDSQAAVIWQLWGFETEAHPADWSLHGKAAGPIRNQEMVDLGADLCLAFVAADSRGTRHCASAAEEAGIPVQFFYE